MKSHQFKKKFGQNFLSDKNLLKSIVLDSNVKSDDNVLEIGAGLGSLTLEIADKAKRLVSYEIDYDLKDKLTEIEKTHKNTKIIFKNILEEDEENISSFFDGEPYKVIANIPYYITSPIIMKFLEANYKPESLTIMIQKELAERIIAKPSTKNYGILSVIVSLFANAKIIRKVDRKMFYPVPNVDSSILCLKTKKEQIKDSDKIIELVKHSFSQRRKTLANNISRAYNIEKSQVQKILKNEFKNENIRAENLTTEDMILLSSCINKLVN